MAVRRDYHHPFTPYGIQLDFMDAVYQCIGEGKVGIFESPTGTGKSLSLICGSLTWLREHKRKQLEEQLSEAVANEDEPEWMVEHAKAEKRRQVLQRRNDTEERLAKIRAKEAKARQRFERGEPPAKRARIGANETSTSDADEAQFALDDYESEDESAGSKMASKATADGISSETQALIDKLGDYLKPAAGTDEAEADEELKVIFCSRTHSQLSQFVNELRRVKMPPALPPDPGIPDASANQEEALAEDFKHLVLGSRKNLCINSKVKKLGNATAINERCLELQQPSTPKDSKCKFLPNPDSEALVNDFRDHTMAKVRDIEDLGQLGEKIGICPYYASRAAINPSEIATLPYPLLLQKSAREALKLSLKNHVVIVDEAHNLTDTISELYSVSVSVTQLKRARSQMTAYLQKFRNRLKGKNRVYVTQLVRLVDSIAVYLQTKQQPASQGEGIVQIGDLMTGKGVDQINLYKLMHYLQESKLARKVDGYTDFAEQQPNQSGGPQARSKRASVPVLMQVQSFMLALTYPSAEGRFFYSRSVTADASDGEVVLKYLLLDPTHHFKEIVEEARAVILAGGTMSPMDDYKSHLLHYMPSERIMTLSCGHVIPSSNLVALPVVQGRSGVEFEFTYERRGSQAMLQELGRTVLAAAQVIPDGLVVFFPSYAYLNTAVNSWKTVSGDGTPWDRMSTAKRIFMEKTEVSAGPSEEILEDKAVDSKHEKVDQILAKYTSHINDATDQRGALLFAVIGGSLSEGINFADQLGRGIMVVGLPFPNAQSPEWKAKMEFAEKRASTLSERGSAAREFYTSACMRAVNQSIGRAIRHKDDYAAIMLVDKRYRRADIQGKLPGWIKASLFTEDRTLNGTIDRLQRFFANKSKC